MSLVLSKALSEKAASFPESSYGAVGATLVLKNGTHVPDVVLAWGSEIVRVENRSVECEADLGFKISDIADVTQL